MTLYDLISRLSWPEVRAALLWLYPDEKVSLEAYRDVLARLKRLEPAESEMRIIVQKRFQPEIDEAPHIDVTGRDGTLNCELEGFQHFKDRVDDEYSNAEADYSLSFDAWASWLGMRIDSATLKDFPPAHIAAHCLWDMTFHGFEEDEVQGTLAELKQQVDEIDAMTEEEREKFLIPAEEVFESFESQWGSEDKMTSHGRSSD